MEKISIIIPVYNVKKYLNDCIQSVINQTYNNLEIILIDDGSTDGSGDYCDEIAKKDSRIFVYHKTNGGLSEARNVGIKISTGKYITFIDSDDYIENLYIETLYNSLIEYKADIAIVNKYHYCIAIANQKELLKKHFPNNPKIYKLDSQFREIYCDILNELPFKKRIKLGIIRFLPFIKRLKYQFIESR